MKILSGCGIGLRKEHFDAVLEQQPAVAFFEAISENFMTPGGRPRQVLEQVRREYPLALHGVSLSIGSDEPVNRDYLQQLRALVDWIQPTLVSDHMCWTGLGGHNSHDLLPLAYTESAAHRIADKIIEVQDYLGRRILVENISSYLEYQQSEMSEPEFLARVATLADCHILLDVNNVYVNSRNHGFDAVAYLRQLPRERVRQIHLAGHTDHGDVLIDTHDRPVCNAVWRLYRYAIERFGALPTLIEWDAQVPDLPVVLSEAGHAEAIMTLHSRDPEQSGPVPVARFQAARRPRQAVMSTLQRRAG